MEEIKKIEVQGQQYGVADMLMRSVMGGNAQVIEWSHTHNMNDYKDAGTYRIKGERTGSPLDDNLPIMNQGSGHTIEGILYVLDSSLPNGSGNSDDCTITQFLMLSNRVGGQEGDMYMRSAYGPNKNTLTWKPWEKYQTNMEVGAVTEGNTMNPQNPTQVLKYGYGMRDLIDNGIYSGVYLGPKTMIGTTEDPYTMEIKDLTAIETFVMVVINNYVAEDNARCITQIKFAVTNGGVFSMEKRSTIPGGTTSDWSQWSDVGGNNGVSIQDYNGCFMIGTSLNGQQPSTIPQGLNAKNYTWDYTSNANSFNTQGYYLITGERTGENDNLPLSKSTLGSGHTLRMVLTVLDSSLPNLGNDSKDCCITQILQCSNRTGGDGNVYVRTASGINRENLTWEPWAKLQTNVEFNGLMDNVKTLDPVTFEKINSIGVNYLVDNGIYSGVYAPPKSLLGSEIYSPDSIGDPTAFETFVMVVINNYAAAGDARVVTQIKFAVSNGGVFSMEKRNSLVGTTNMSAFHNNGYWSEWESIGGGSGLGKWDDKSTFVIEHIENDSGNITIGSDTAIGSWVKIGNSVHINSVSDGDYGIEYGIALGTGDVEGGIIKIGQNVRIPNNLKFSVSSNILTITNGVNTWKLTAE